MSPEGNGFFRLKSAVGTAGYLKNAPKSILFPEMFLQTFRVASARRTSRSFRTSRRLPHRLARENAPVVLSSRKACLAFAFRASYGALELPKLGRYRD